MKSNYSKEDREAIDHVLSLGLHVLGDDNILITTGNGYSGDYSVKEVGELNGYNYKSLTAALNKFDHLNTVNTF